ncbi:hypothetical protein C8F01DRAFT_1122102 [Mycena amicta]|nr:hypothetical protein C8F01DRAFT_1122102 [Mycena amicta]
MDPYNARPWGEWPQYQQHAQQLPYHTAQYLLGMTNEMPPPMPQDLAMAQHRRMFDSGIFDGSHAQPSHDGSAQGSASASRAATRQRETTFDTIVPTAGVNGGAPVNITLALNRTIEPDDFLARIRANMLAHQDIPLGWKTTRDTKRDPGRRLLTNDDAKQAIKSILELVDSTRRTNPVALVIVDTRAPTDKPAKEPKETELAYREEMAVVKECLACDECSTGFCFRRKGPNGEKIGPHQTVDWSGLTLWARLMKNKPEDVPRDCSIPPNCIKFDKIANPKERRQQRSSRPGSTTNVEVKPDIHIHLADGPLGPAYTNHGQAKPRSNLGKRTRTDSSDDEDDYEIVPITELLANLDKKMPTTNFSQYKDMLHNEKIDYCHQLVQFSADELRELGVGRGAVKDLRRGAKKALHKSKKQRVEEKENEPEHN